MLITMDELRAAHERKTGINSRTAKAISRRIGRKVSRCEVEEVCTDPHVWRCFVVFDTTFSGKQWACEHGDTRKIAVNATVLAAKKVIDLDATTAAEAFR